MRILITGATGFVGLHLVRHLRQAEPAAPIVGTVHGHAAPPDPTGCITSPAMSPATAARTSAPSFARPGPTTCTTWPARRRARARTGTAIFRANVEGTRTVMAAASDEMPLGRVLFISTGYVYGDCDPERPATEADALRPAGLYAESKRDAEPVARAAGAIIARAFNHTGPGQTTAFAVPAFAAQIAAIERGAQPPELSASAI